MTESRDQSGREPSSSSKEAAMEPCPACNHDAPHTLGRGCYLCNCGCVFLEVQP